MDESKARGPWVAVDKNNNEHMFHKRPVPVDGKYYVDKITYGEVRAYTTSADDYSILLPSGTIEKIIGRKLTFADGPVKLSFE